ncbi:MAG: GDSL-type esterase/lipase family protein [Ruminococcus sp.]
MKKIITLILAIIIAVGNIQIVFADDEVSTNTTELIGDVNNDKLVNIRDSTIIQRYICKKTTLDENSRVCADTNGDGSITIADATVIQKYLVRIIAQLPKENTLYGKRLAILGDSYTEGTNKYHNYISDRTGLVVLNYGVIGSAITQHHGEYSDDFIKRVESMEEDVDAVLVFGGINDAQVLGTNQITMGTIDSEDTNTFYGALKTLCEMLIDKFPDKEILALIPPYINPNSGDHRAENIDIICEAEIEVYTKYAIPFLDLRVASGITTSDEDINKYFDHSTSIHWNRKGHEKASYPIQKFIEANLY